MSYPRKMEKLLGAALMRDEEYRKLLLKDPAGAAKVVGIKLTDEEIAYIRTLDAKILDALARELRNISPRGAVAW